MKKIVLTLRKILLALVKEFAMLPSVNKAMTIENKYIALGFDIFFLC